MKMAPGLHLYLVGDLEQNGVARVLSDLGLVGQALGDPSTVVQPALIVLGPGQSAPEGMADIAIAPPPDASPAALRELIRIAMENVVLKEEVRQLRELERRQHRQFEELNRIGTALSAERDIAKLQGFILTTMRQLTNADGASLWLKTTGEDGKAELFLASSQNTSIDNTYQAFKVPVDEKTVVGYTVSVGSSQIYEDAYQPPPVKPQGGKRFDTQVGYRTKPMLTVPMRNYTNEVVGAIQLINAKQHYDTRLTVDTVADHVTSFRPEDLEMLESVASQAAVALDNKRLLDEIQNLFDSFVQASVTAIEQRDPATKGHSERVARLTIGIARAVTDIGVGKYRDVWLNDDQFKELRYACLLHDFGKVGVREDVLVKAKKLFPGQLEAIEARFDGLQWSAVARYANEKFAVAKAEGFDSPKVAEIDRQLDAEVGRLRAWIDAIASANEPSVLPEDKASTLEDLSRQTYQDSRGRIQPILEPQEFRYLSIQKGTLDAHERSEIEEHVTNSFKFLSQIPWTPLLRDIPEIAYGHHEKLDGTGYPRHLTEPEIKLQTKMMTISDIYDALTAQDRAYKPAVPHDRALDILHKEFAGKVDPDLLDVFIAKRVYEESAGR
jgi:HD-GYP domain-containing protein (c-di-GMP phosphodiesterase class II)